MIFSSLRGGCNGTECKTDVHRPHRPRGGEPVIDFQRLGAWMDEAGLPRKGAPIEHRVLSRGTQNEIHEVVRGDERCVIRIPPPEAPADRDKGILREWRIVEALDGT